MHMVSTLEKMQLRPFDHKNCVFLSGKPKFCPRGAGILIAKPLRFPHLGVM
jgi:hypothetical protein